MVVVVLVVVVLVVVVVVVVVLVVVVLVVVVMVVLVMVVLVLLVVAATFERLALGGVLRKPLESELALALAFSGLISSMPQLLKDSVNTTIG